MDVYLGLVMQQKIYFVLVDTFQTFYGIQYFLQYLILTICFVLFFNKRSHHFNNYGIQIKLFIAKRYFIHLFLINEYKEEWHLTFSNVPVHRSKQQYFNLIHIYF